MSRKTVLITGASRGIGRETARLFAALEYNVVINYNRSEKQAKELHKELTEMGCSSIIFKADVSSYSEVKSMINYTLAVFGKIDVLINNAAVAQIAPFCDVTEEEYDYMMDVNLKGVFNVCSCAMKTLLENKNGKVINISSAWGLTGSSCEVIYSASKAGVIGFTKALAKELAPSNITVNCVAPGLIDTEMNDDLSQEEISDVVKEIPLGRMGTAREVAELLLFLASDKSNYITGQVISPNGGWIMQ